MNIEPSIDTIEKLSKIANKLLGKNNIRIILEFGSRYGEDSIEFAKRYPKATVYSFECNPNTLEVCKDKVSAFKNIVLTEKAVSNINGHVSFFKIDEIRTKTTWTDGNQGASSLFIASGKYPVESYVQEEIKVESIMLSTFITQNNIPEIDILWMDIQGAELLALKGLGHDIHRVKIIHLEVEFFEIYQNQPLFNEIKTFLNKFNFNFLGFSYESEYAADAVFINSQYISKKAFYSCEKFLVRQPNILKSEIEKGKYIFKNVLSKVIRKALLLALHSVKRIRQIDTDFNIYLPVEFRKRELLLWRLKVINPLFNIDKNFRQDICSLLPIDIIIPASFKDVQNLKIVMTNALKFIKHPINKIYVVAPSNPQIIKICEDEGGIFVDEEFVLPFKRKSIKYVVDNEDRSGWLFQQLLKLNADTIAEMDNYLILDADTIFIKPKIFHHAGKTIFDFSEERHDPYHTVYEKILKNKTKSELSFVTHYMLFNKTYLQNLKSEIESIHLKLWTEVILENVDYTNKSGFSEYEMYGNFVLAKYSKKIKKEYWFNTVNPFTAKLNYIKSLSLHSYLDREDLLNDHR